MAHLEANTTRLLIRALAEQARADSRVKLCGNWVIEVAMGCSRLYNHKNPAKFRLVASLARRLER